MSEHQGQYIPDRNYTVIKNTYQSPQMQYESDKWRIQADLQSTVHCLNKCNVNVSSVAFNDTEKVCMSKCYTKLFDCQLLVAKELELYTFANPYTS